MKTFNLTFCGGAGVVTGAQFLLEREDGFSVLIDCGLEQGSGSTILKNNQPFPFDPRKIKALFITHAHIDHIGLIPKLVKDGFNGTIYSTPPTRDLSTLMLLDAHKVMTNEAERSNLEPLYDVSDIEKAMSIWQVKEYREPFTVDSITATFYDSGHILGSAMVRLQGERKAITFSGDLGNKGSLLLPSRDIPDESAYLLMESVYGDRNHEPISERKRKLKSVIMRALEESGTILIPAFSLERTQDLLYELNELIENKEVPRIPVFLDSPLAIDVTEVYKKYSTYFNEDVRKDIESGDSIFTFPGLQMTYGKEESKGINEVVGAKIIIAGAGMSHAGRIVFHEKRYLDDPHTTLLLVGYQVPGGFGRKLLDGEKRVKILGEEITVRARIEKIMSYSAHADSEGLLEFADEMKQRGTKEIFVAMGEPKASTFLAQRIRDFLDIEAIVPEEGETFEIQL